MIKISLRDLGCSPFDFEVNNWSEVKNYLEKYNYLYTHAVFVFEGRYLEAWRFVGERQWYSNNVELLVSETALTPGKMDDKIHWLEQDKMIGT